MIARGTADEIAAALSANGLILRGCVTFAEGEEAPSGLSGDPWDEVLGNGGGEQGQARHFSSGGLKALRQTSLWMMLATLAPPDSGSFQVKASGMDSFFLAMNSPRPSAIPWSSGGAS